MGEGGLADIGGMAIGRPIEPFVENPRGAGETREMAPIDARFIVHLEHQARQQ